MEGTNVTEKAVLSILSSQRNLENIESEFVTPALLKLVNNNDITADQSILGTENEDSGRVNRIETNINR